MSGHYDKNLDAPMDDTGPLPRRDVRKGDEETQAPRRDDEAQRPTPRSDEGKRREPEEPHGPSGAV